MFTRRVRLPFAILSVLLIVSGCASTQQPGPSPTTSEQVEQAEKVLRVGVSPRYKPVIFKEKGKVTGLEADFAQAFGEHLGKSVRFVELQRTNLIPALLDNRIDIILDSNQMLGKFVCV